jgi:hypothetical protein
LAGARILELYAVPWRLIDVPVEVPPVEAQFRVDLHDGNFDAGLMAKRDRRHPEICGGFINTEQALVARHHTLDASRNGVRESLEELIPSAHSDIPNRSRTDLAQMAGKASAPPNRSTSARMIRADSKLRWSKSFAWRLIVFAGGLSFSLVWVTGPSH